MISERVRAGLERVRASGPAKGKKAIGRPLNTDPAIAERVRQMRAEGIGLLRIGRTLGIGTGLVQRLALLKSSARPKPCERRLFLTLRRTMALTMGRIEVRPVRERRSQAIMPDARHIVC